MAYSKYVNYINLSPNCNAPRNNSIRKIADKVNRYIRKRC